MKRGSAHAWKGHWEQAAEEYRLALGQSPKDLSARTYLAMALYKAGQLQGALELYDQLWKEQPSNLSMLQRLAEVQEVLGDRESAVASYRVLAEIHGRRRSAGEALKAWEKVVELRPGEPALWDSLMDAAAQAGVVGQMMPAYLGLARGLSLEGRFEEAIQVVQRAQTLDPANRWVVLLLEDIRSALGYWWRAAALGETPTREELARLIPAVPIAEMQSPPPGAAEEAPLGQQRSELPEPGKSLAMGERPPALEYTPGYVVPPASESGREWQDREPVGGTSGSRPPASGSSAPPQEAREHKPLTPLPATDTDGDVTLHLPARTEVYVRLPASSAEAKTVQLPQTSESRSVSPPLPLEVGQEEAGTPSEESREPQEDPLPAGPEASAEPIEAAREAALPGEVSREEAPAEAVVEEAPAEAAVEGAPVEAAVEEVAQPAIEAGEPAPVEAVAEQDTSGPPREEEEPIPVEAAAEEEVPEPPREEDNVTPVETVVEETAELALEEEEPAPVEAATEREESHGISIAERLLEAAEVHERLGQVEEAAVAYRQVLELSPNLSAALLGVARFHLSRGRLEEAEEEVRRDLEPSPLQVEEMDSSPVELLLDILRARAAGGDLGAAAEGLAWLRSRIAADGFPAVVVGRAAEVSVELLGQCGGEHVEEIALLPPEVRGEVVLALRRAEDLLMAGQLRSAADEVYRLIAARPDFLPPQSLLGRVLIAQGRREMARERSQRLLKLYEMRGAPHHAVGVLWWTVTQGVADGDARSQLVELLRAQKRVLEAESMEVGGWEALVRLAETRFALGDRGGAVNLLKEAVVVKGTTDEATRAALVRALQVMGDEGRQEELVEILRRLGLPGELAN